MAKAKVKLVEKCPKCQSLEFAIDKGVAANRHCSECHHVWAAMSKEELQIQDYKEKWGAAISFAKEVNVGMDEVLVGLKVGRVDHKRLTSLVKDIKKQSEIVCSRA